MHVDDDISHVTQNRQLLRQQLQLPDEPYWLNQTHSTVIVEANDKTTLPTADASYTQTKNVVCAVMTADCLPLLICDRAGTIVAAIHAGWKGLANGVIESSIAALPVSPNELLVWLGPAIGPTAFEVGEDVVSVFMAHDTDAKIAFHTVSKDCWLGNLYVLATQRLHALGVTAIYGGNHCTYREATQFYSFRRDNRTGRMASLIWLS
jgi:YfiH family protein